MNMWVLSLVGQQKGKEGGGCREWNISFNAIENPRNNIDYYQNALHEIFLYLERAQHFYVARNNICNELEQIKLEFSKPLLPYSSMGAS